MTDRSHYLGHIQVYQHISVNVSSHHCCLRQYSYRVELWKKQKLVSVDTGLKMHTMACEIRSCGLQDIKDTKCITCKCNQVGEAKTIGKNNELHCIQIGPRTEPPRIQVFQHSPHTADSCVGKQHLKGTHASPTGNKIKESHVIIKTRICFSSASVFQGC